jgi:hypothetical protein
MKREVQQQKSEQYVTISVFEKAIHAISGRFDGIEAQLKRNTEIMVREFSAMHEEHAEFRSALRMHDREITLHDRKIDGLTDRVEALEVKTR